MTTTEQQIEQIKYKQLYQTTLRENKLLTARVTKLNSEIRILQSKLNKEVKTELSAPLQKIKDAINTYFNVDIDVKIRQGNYVRGRVVYYFILRSSTSMSYMDISGTLNTRHNHASIIHAIANHHDWFEYDKIYKKDFNAIMEILNTQNETSPNNN
jgi:chromosomal replication initiation ATPase DnaA